MKYTSRFSQIPQKAEPKEQSELVNQILYGEHFELIEEAGNWVKVKTTHDHYIGFIDSLFLDQCPFEEQPNAVVQAQDIHLKHGIIQIPEGGFSTEESHTILPIAERAYQWLGTPYLWGGKTKWGVDCSGLIQVLMRPFFPNFPRDAFQQFPLGKEIEFDQIEEGDIAFFEKNNKIHHVGVLVDKGTHIIHSSGFVKKNELCADGIKNEKGEITHIFAGARRFPLGK
ncbi:MAG: cell wall-associated NlpC family hydrolase [Sphingobacteriales bacterium]|jgi:cell wall-associated NlpC family hydrolase